MPDIQIAEQIATSQSVFAILFIILLIVGYRAISKYLKDVKMENDKREKEIKDLYTEHKDESKQREIEAKERENKLMLHLERSDKSHEKTTRTLEKIEVSLQSLENKTQKMDIGINDIWKRLDEIDNKQSNGGINNED